ncbi:MAG: flagellar biosynthesis protein FlhB [Ignavibacteria bacterium GWB2_35_12]|nr:MAG: flagellar biosynthesis protein FlhB [Ignavibacteria bacterium GWA2_35_8]OGU38182.1 MAG: flagellar biosynthesis protein FlhB [Ignavibacteria bacterium GWB2_35_12]OGU93938.1 MAG: flagellar biosynthesis protein FlhB [Ignavibacteria bacterium RIFOXYA2_FULL_35_10]OGV20039.1 MAG: flagellar biosynthesis protein FlhB [Ignavibacteria bacterium RIFOXYC2_FULL_35_21]
MAENKEGQEKTEPASAKRLNEARARGQVSKSFDVTTAAMMLFGGIIVFLFGKALISGLQEFMRYIFYNSSSINITQDNIGSIFLQLLLFLAKVLLPILVLVMLIAFVAEVSQVGFKFATKKFTEGLHFKRIFNPIGGLRKIFMSGRAVFELVKSFAKLLLFSLIVYQVLSSRAEETVGLMERPIDDIGAFIASVCFELLTKISLVFILIAIADFFYQKYRFREDMKMTKQETKEESKQTEGDPKIKQRIRSILRSRLRKLMLKKVKTAEVVITNPTHFAVALSYKSEDMSAPILVAKGLDYLALQIREIAEQSGVPIVEDPPLARVIYYKVDVEQEIPENLFKAVAQVLAYVYHLKRKVG